MRKTYSAAGKLFGQMLGVIGGAGILVSLFMNSVIPILISVITLTVLLYFLSGFE